MRNENYRTVVKQQHLRHREIVLITALVVLGVVFIGGYVLGQWGASGAVMASSVAHAENGSIGERQQLQQELDAQHMQHELDVATLELVRKEIASQRDQIATLEEGMRFYKGLMAPEEIAQGLSLRPLELVATESSDRFVFRLVAQQEAVKHTTLKGSLTVELFGRQGEDEVGYSLAELSEDIDDNKITLRFRYFQSIEGELIVPAGFVPQGFRVIARASSPRKVELREQFPWEVQERFTYVGK